jgi:hypothetical protein
LTPIASACRLRPETEERGSATGFIRRAETTSEAAYAMQIHAGKEIIADKSQHFRVLDVVPFDEEDESPFVVLLQVEAA